MLVILLIEAIPAIRYNGLGFFTSSVWEPGNAYGTPIHAGGVYHLAGAHFGAWPLIAGTLESSAIALVVGFPIAVGAAVLLVEKLPARAGGGARALPRGPRRHPVRRDRHLGASSPSARGSPSTSTRSLTHLPNVPVLNIFRGVPSHDGEGLLTGGLVLAVMIIPIIAATSRDLLRQVPETTKEGAEALGMTDAEVFWTVQARWVRAGVIGAAVLGLGRALGETIAIALVSGGARTSRHQHLRPDDDDRGDDRAAAELARRPTRPASPSKTLAEAALVLLAITLVVNVVARMIVRRAARGAALPARGRVLMTTLVRRPRRAHAGRTGFAISHRTAGAEQRSGGRCARSGSSSSSSRSSGSWSACSARASPVWHWSVLTTTTQGVGGRRTRSSARS